MSLLWKECGLPERHKTFKASQNALEAWKTQWDKLQPEIGMGIIGVILGKRGAGKTQMAACAVREACEKELSAIYCKAIDFFLDVRASYRKDSQSTEKDVINQYRKPKLLVIDAIENRGETDFENRLLDTLIDKRYDDCTDTLLISNQDEKAFAASMGASIIDRIHECGIMIICNWESFRRK